MKGQLMMKQLTIEDKQVVVQMYLDGVTEKNIANHFGCRKQTITDFLRSNGYERRKRNAVNGAEQLKKSRKHFFNESYFRDIDSEEKAYWLGFLYADGCVCFQTDKNGKEKGGRVELTLKSSDLCHLKKFLQCLSADNDYPIYDKQVTLDGKIYSAKRVLLNSIEMCKDLAENGCIPNKSLILKRPVICDDLANHFIRGYFDGDGCVSFNENTKIGSVSILGTYDVLDFIRSKSDIYNNCKITSNGSQGLAYMLSLPSLSDRIIFYRYIYNNAHIYLKRKKDIYDSLYFCAEKYNKEIVDNTLINDVLIKHKRRGTPVVRISMDMEEIKIYDSMSSAYYEILGRRKGNGISQCCNHRQKTAYGYYWLKYKEYVDHKTYLKEYILNFILGLKGENRI